MSSSEIPDQNPEYDNWPVEGREHENIRYVGTTNSQASVPGAHVFYDPDAGSLFTGSPDEESETIIPHPDHEWELHPEERVGEALERVGEELHWDALTEFAEEHLLEEESEES